MGHFLYICKRDVIPYLPFTGCSMGRGVHSRELGNVFVFLSPWSPFVMVMTVITNIKMEGICGEREYVKVMWGCCEGRGRNLNFPVVLRDDSSSFILKRLVFVPCSISSFSWIVTLFLLLVNEWRKKDFERLFLLH